MLILCILIKLTSPGPLIYKQERVGLHNQTFRMYKFRSMEIQKESEEKKAWTVKNDPRVTGSENSCVIPVWMNFHSFSIS